MKTTMIAAVGTATAAACIGVASPAYADNVVYQFSQPGGNIDCVMGNNDSGQPFAACQIGKISYQPPPPPPGACPGYGHLFRLDQGNPAYLGCKGDPLVYPKPAPLDWEQTQTFGSLECQNSVGLPAQAIPASTLLQ